MANGGVVVVVSGQDDTGKVFQAIENNLKHTTAAAHETERAFGQLGERAKRYLEYAGIAFGVREVLDSFKEVILKSAEFGEQLNDTSRNTGLAVETLSTLHYAAAITGEDFEGVAGSVSKLGVALAQAAAGGNKKADTLFGSLGLNAKELAKQSDGVEVAFKRVAQAIASTENPSQRLLLARELLGRSGTREIAMLSDIGNSYDEWVAKAKAAGVFMTSEHAAQLEELNHKMKAMQQSVLGASVAFADGFTPSLSRMLDVLSGGQSHMEMFQKLGDKVARTLATLAEGALVTASALEYMWAGPSDALNKYRQEELANARELWKMAQDMYHAQTAPPSTSAEPTPGRPKPGAGFTAPDLSGGEDKLDSARKARDAARLRLDEQMATLRAQIQKAAQDQQLAQLESDHARNLVSDRAYYAQKLAIEKTGYDAQRTAALEKQAEIDAAIAKLEADKKKHGGSSEESAKAVEDEAKILELRTKRATLDGEIAKINAEGAKAEIESALKVYELLQKQMELVDELAAKREAIVGGNVEDRLHQSSDNYLTKRKDLVSNFGEGSKEVSDADFAFSNEQGHIRATGAEEISGNAVAGVNARRQAVDDAEARGTLSTLEAQRQKIQLDQEEAQALRPVLAAYEELAQAGDLQATQKVIELRSKIGELANPVDEVAAHMRESFDSAFEGLFENLDTGLKGLESFAKDVQRIFEQAAYKRLFEPFIQNSLGKLIPNAAGGPASGGGVGNGQPFPGVVPFVAPKNPGTDIGGGAVRAAASIGSSLGIPGLGGLEKKGKDGTITIVLDNQSGLPLKLGDIKPGGNVDRASVEAILKDSFEEGGLMRSLLTGFHL